MAKSFFREHEGAIYGVLAALSLSVMAIFIKSSQGVPNSMLVFTRFLISWLIVVPWMVKYRVHLTWKGVPIHVMRGVVLLGGNS